MKEYTLKDFLSLETQNKIKTWSLSFSDDIDDIQGVFYNKGDEIDCLRGLRFTSEGFVMRIGLIAPESSVYDFSMLFLNLPINGFNFYNLEELLNDSVVLCKAYDSFQEFAYYKIEQNCSYSVVDDFFKGRKQIVWSSSYLFKQVYSLVKYHRSIRNINAFPLKLKKYVFVNLQNSKEQFEFQYPKRGFTTHKFAKGDVFHFIFENKEHLKFQLKSSATNTNDPNLKQISFSMLPQDIKQFANNNVVAIRCEFQNGDTPLDLEWENEASAIMLKLYFQKYIIALLECGVDIDKIPAASESIKRPINELDDELIDTSCFVYLMKDESNGYHKIGISNKPEYRERTLQSEKPTIVLLCAKKFPSRVIAEAIEAALHKAYGNKRLRGEWFELDDKDVFDIKATLS